MPSAAEPYLSQLAGDADRAATLWTDLGCPYDAALALIDSADEDRLRSRSRGSSASVPGRRRPSWRAGCARRRARRAARAPAAHPDQSGPAHAAARWRCWR